MNFRLDRHAGTQLVEIALVWFEANAYCKTLNDLDVIHGNPTDGRVNSEGMRVSSVVR